MPVLTEFRKAHPIEPVPVYSPGTLDPEWHCNVCAVPLYEIRGGWRHEPVMTRELPRPSTWPGR